MSIDHALLTDLGVKENIINRLTALFKQQIPSPPLEMKGLEGEGGYSAINEFYAMKLLQEKGARITIQSVRELVGGKTTTVADNVRRLRSELPQSTFQPNSEPITNDELAAFKRKLVQAETAEFSIQLNEQEQKYIDEIEQIEDSANKRIRDLEKKLDIAHGENGSLQALTNQQQLSIARLQDALRKESVNEAELRNAQLRCYELKEALSTQQDLNTKLETAFIKFEKAAAIRTDELTDRLGESVSNYKLMEQKLYEIKQDLVSSQKENHQLIASNNELNLKVNLLTSEKSSKKQQYELIEGIYKQVGESLKGMDVLPKIIEQAKVISIQNTLNEEGFTDRLIEISDKLSQNSKHFDRLFKALKTSPRPTQSASTISTDT